MPVTTRNKRDTAKARMQAEAEGHALVSAAKTSTKKTQKLQKLQEKLSQLTEEELAELFDDPLAEEVDDGDRQDDEDYEAPQDDDNQDDDENESAGQRGGADEEEDEEELRLFAKRPHGSDTDSEEEAVDEAPKKKRSRRAKSPHVLDDDSDEEVMNEAPQKQRSRRAKNLPSADPMFTSSSPAVIPSRLPQRRIATTATQRHTSQTLPLSSPPPSPRSTASAAQVSTPPQKIKTSGKATLKMATPSSKSALRISISLFRIYVSIRKGFPNETEVVSEGKACFLDASREINAPGLARRLQSDEEFCKYVINILKQRTSQLRGEVKTKAQTAVGSYYGFTGKTSDEVKIAVAKLVDRSSFAFANAEERKGAYGNPLLLTIIIQQWFAKKKSLGRGPHSGQFNPMPLPLIALVATAVECAINDWSDGVYAPGQNDFEEEPYANVYQKHIKNLTQWSEGPNRAGLTDLQKKLWEDAWRIGGGGAVATEGGADMDENDFAS